MVKFPSQNKLQYVTGAISNDAWTTPTSGGTTGALNLPKDFSILNRRGYGSTDNKGVPWVYKVRVDLFLQDEDGFGLNTVPGIDFMTTLKIDGVANNWINRNAAVKWHAARDNMWKKAGVKRKDLGSWSKSIRYNYDSASQTWLTPIDGAGDGFTGGTWDVSTIVDMIDNEYQLRLVGDGVDEDSSTSVSVLTIGHSYLSSRSTVPTDSNLESSEVPAVYSHLTQLLSPTNLESGTEEAYIRTDVATEQDNPPYEVFATETTQHDCTEAVELGRCVAGFGNSMGSVIVDIPFGLAKMRLTHYDSADTGVTSGALINVTLLDIYPMQG
uniref:Uncharacterized protein n=1 Tax=uncultured marine virus TaxID=186617 RepID=S4TF41_9VIRU|nr:hypothetical protein [uncultured marine virus]